VKVEFLPEADEEFREAARYYESEAAGVSMAFIAAVHKAVDEVVESACCAGSSYWHTQEGIASLFVQPFLRD